MTEGPVFVISEPASTEYEAAVPNGTGVAMASACVGVTATMTPATVAASPDANQPDKAWREASFGIFYFIERPFSVGESWSTAHLAQPNSPAAVTLPPNITQ